MINSIKYFIIQSKYNIKNAHALTRSFWVGVLSMVLNNSTFFIIWFLFMNATGPINGWTSLDVFGMLGVALVSYGVTHSFFYGIADLPQFVTKGTFDNVLLAPVNSFLKLGGSSFSVTAYGDLLQGIAVTLIYGLVVKFSIMMWVLYALAIFLGCIIFLCIKLLCCLVVFFIYDGGVISDQLFEIFTRPSLYPGAMFPSKLKLFFMTIIPALLTSTAPIDIVKFHSLSLIVIGVFVTFVWVFITYTVYRLALRRYESGNYLR